MQAGDVKEKYDAVIHSLDELIAKHGYEREGYYYRPVEANNDTIVLFCHFALECVLLSHLLNISPMALWHGTCAAPSSVTTVVTEERREGIAYWRMLAFGDTSHLYHHDEPASYRSDTHLRKSSLLSAPDSTGCFPADRSFQSSLHSNRYRGSNHFLRPVHR